MKSKFRHYLFISGTKIVITLNMSASQNYLFTNFNNAGTGTTVESHLMKNYFYAIKGLFIEVLKST